MREALNPSRRGLLGRAALAAPAVALVSPPGAVLAAPADPHEAWEREVVGLCDSYDDPAWFHLPEEERERRFRRICELEDALHLTEARTLAGVRAQLREMVGQLEKGELLYVQQDGLAVTLAALDRIAAEGGRP